MTNPKELSFMEIILEEFGQLDTRVGVIYAFKS